MGLKMTNKISFVARLRKFEGEEYKRLSLTAYDSKSEKYTLHGSGRVTVRQRRINFTKIMDEFKNNDLVKITFQKIGVHK